MNPTSSPCLDRIADTRFKIMVFGHPFNRSSEAERWIRWTPSTGSGLAQLGTALVVNSGSVPPPAAGARISSGGDWSGPTIKLFVGSLSFNSTNENLAHHFARCGDVVSASVIMDRDSGRSKGFGFVEMRTREEAERAVDGLSDQELDGRRLTVNFAKPMPERSPRPNRY